jgi:hypothetical protein|tara:strand:- start:282 stop:482 length:201 start_codon:yes stop_codon:yes gene_type:complete
MSDYTTRDAIDFAFDGNSAKFKDAIHDIMSSKVADAIELKRVEVASQFMSAQDTDQGETDVQDSEV